MALKQPRQAGDSDQKHSHGYQARTPGSCFPWYQINLITHWVLIPGFENCFKSWASLETLNDVSDCPLNRTFSALVRLAPGLLQTHWDTPFPGSLFTALSFWEFLLLSSSTSDGSHFSLSLFLLLGFPLDPSPTVHISHLNTIILSCWRVALC